MRCIAVVCCCLIVSPASAASFGTLGLVGEANSPCVTAEAFEPFAFYVVVSIDFADDGRPGDNAENGLRAWRGRVHTQSVSIMGASVLPPTSLDAAVSAEDFVVTLAATTASHEAPVRLARIWAGIFHHDPVEWEPIEMRETSSVSDGLGWTEGADGSTHTFAHVESLLVNCTGASTATHWGTVKARY